MDVICAQCGEPWGYYGIHHGDFEQEDIEPFLRGKNCPCCKDHPKHHSGRFEEQHWSTLLEASDEPDEILRIMPLGQG